jgi:hypothetical protein
VTCVLIPPAPPPLQSGFPLRSALQWDIHFSRATVLVMRFGGRPGFHRPGPRPVLADSGLLAPRGDLSQCNLKNNATLTECCDEYRGKKCSDADTVDSGQPGTVRAFITIEAAPARSAPFGTQDKGGGV